MGVKTVVVDAIGSIDVNRRRSVGRSLNSNTTKRQAALERFVVGETRLARGSNAYLREEGQACLLSEVQHGRIWTVHAY